MKNRICSVDGCVRKHSSGGMCHTHYVANRRGHSLNPLGPILKQCSVPDCETGAIARGWCGAHYARWHKYGDPNAVAPPRPPKPTTGIDKPCITCGELLDISKRKNGRCPTCYLESRRKCACGAPISFASRSGLCKKCWGAKRRSQTPVRRLYEVNGYIILTGQWSHPNVRSRGHLFEHVKVMTEQLGRPLLPDENVHHINGVKDDNRPENLELWSTHQPPGQRVSDKVAWAKDLLAKYEPDALAERGAR